jgi:hypothetical protein
MPADSRPLAASPFFIPSLVVGALAVVTVLGLTLGLPIALLGAAAFVLSLVITLMWQSLQHLSGEAGLTLDEALSLAAPTAEEEQKRAVLRALKDLEYERSVGKVSQADYLELSARYREDAKRLILAVDEGLAETRTRAEKLLDERMSPETRPSPGTDAPKKGRKKSKKPAERQPAAAASGSTTEAAQEAATEGEAAPAQSTEAPSSTPPRDVASNEPTDASTEARNEEPPREESRRDEESR